jgi:hypothetical protein
MGGHDIRLAEIDTGVMRVGRKKISIKRIFFGVMLGMIFLGTAIASGIFYMECFMTPPRAVFMIQIHPEPPPHVITREIDKIRKGLRKI